jgi:Transposase zinc-binding domain
VASSLEVADIFRAAGPAYRTAHAGHLSLVQLKVMTAIENCRTAALGGHVEACTDCGHWRIAYNSCRNRHCPKCQGAAARTWLAERKADLLPVGYFHVVFTLPAEVADIAWQNKALLYDLLFKAASETMLTIAADRRQPTRQLLGKRVQLARPCRNLKHRLHRTAAQILADRVARQTRPPLDLADRHPLTKMPPPDYTQ